MEESAGKTRRWTLLGVAGLVAVQISLLASFVSRQSMSWDEGDHLYSGYLSLKTGDFGLNPEHPPMVKMLAALPLLAMNVKVPELERRYFKHEAFLGGRKFVFGNDADVLLFRARMAAATLTVLLSLMAFLAAREMFGVGAAFLALALFVFDPNVLAHGALVTTDSGVSCFLFTTTYLFYRYVKRPSLSRLILVGISAGLALAAKHTGLLVLPTLAVLGATEIFLPAAEAPREGRGARAARVVGALLLVGVLSVSVLWAFYGFRFAPRPRALDIDPPFGESLKIVPKPHEVAALQTLDRWHLLPESYLYGLGDVLFMDSIYTSYVFGKVYPHGVWFYFPVAYAVKSTLTFLLLPVVIVVALLKKRLKADREVVFLALPPLVYLGVAMSSRMNIGVRHILPLYVFIAVLGAGALRAFLRTNRGFSLAFAALVLLQVGTALFTFPAWIAYSNELAGGPEKTHTYLTDSNSDWGQQLKSLKVYLDSRGTKDCWFAYFGQGTADTSYYGIPCRPLPTAGGFWLQERFETPPEIEGTVVVSAGVLSGFEFGPGPLDPYAQFRGLLPVKEIDGGLFVYEGRFKVPLASALALSSAADELLSAGRKDEALEKAVEAAGLAPGSVRVIATLGDALKAVGRDDEARGCYETGLNLARTVEPEFQGFWAKTLEAKTGH